MSIEVPDACTLPTAEQPFRLAEYQDLFTTAVCGIEAVTDTHLRLRLSGPAGLEATVRDLTVRESECCSFFGFSITPSPASDGDAVILDIEVPRQYVSVLAALAQQAREFAPTSGGTANWAAAILPFETDQSSQAAT